MTIKISKVDKTTPLHCRPNVILGKSIGMESNYAKVETKFGIISAYISTNRFNKCTRKKYCLTYTREVTFSTVSLKKAVDHIN